MKNKTKLTNYLTGVAGIAAITAPQANAAVTAITFGFGTTLEGDELSNAPTSPNYGIFLGNSDPDSWGSAILLLGNTYASGNLGDYYGLVKFFSTGTVFGNGANGNLAPGAYFKHSTRSDRDLTSDQAGYIGFKTGNGNWGYADVSWNEASSILTINSAYVESVAGNTITVGALPSVPEPSSLALLAAGSVLAARRRRKVV